MSFPVSINIKSKTGDVNTTVRSYAQNFSLLYILAKSHDITPGTPVKETDDYVITVTYISIQQAQEVGVKELLELFLKEMIAHAGHQDEADDEDEVRHGDDD